MQSAICLFTVVLPKGISVPAPQALPLTRLIITLFARFVPSTSGMPTQAGPLALVAGMLRRRDQTLSSTRFTFEIELAPETS
jgi:hypothetical protein